MKPDVSIIIPTKNEEQNLGNLLSDLQAQTFQNFEVIVADADSTDNTRSIAKEFGASVVDGGHPSYARNAGAKVAATETLVFVDADTRLPDPFFLQRFLDKFSEQNLDAACSIYTYYGSWNIRIVLLIKDLTRLFYQYTPIADATTEFMMIKKHIFNDVKGFSESLKVSEDVDLINKVKKAGYKYRVLSFRILQNIRRFQEVGAFKLLFLHMMGGTQVNLKLNFFEASRDKAYSDHLHIKPSSAKD